MKKFENEELQAIYDEVFADGKVTKEEVESVYSERDEYEYDDEYDDLLLEVVSAYILEDGVFDEEEGQFLIDLILEDDTIDGTEATLIENLIELCDERDIECPENFKSAFDAFFDFDYEEDEEDEE